jgi:hypothetical protein
MSENSESETNSKMPEAFRRKLKAVAAKDKMCAEYEQKRKERENSQ